MGNKQIYKVIGLMSGTSLDGVDAAVLDTDGRDIYGFGPTVFRPYSRPEKNLLHEATQAALKWRFAGPPPAIFAEAEAIIHQAHIEAAGQLIGRASKPVSLIGFHGQTVLHRPPEAGRKGQTLQLGKGQVLADELGIDVAYDFRSADMAAGGQGAPLAPLYHEALLRRSNISRPAAVLNIGGVSNITILQENGEVLASDCGPGNGPLDNWVGQHGLGDFDKDGDLSGSGIPDFSQINTWLAADFFAKPAPKSADRWDFDITNDLAGIAPQDGAATLAVFTAFCVAHIIKKYRQPLEKIIICGGGRHNRTIMLALAEQNIGKIVSAEQIGWNGDSLEAQAFAYLAVRTLLGLPISLPQTTGAPKAMSGGRLAKAI